MANVATAAEAALLNWSMTSGSRYVNVGLTAPNASNGFEIATGSGMTRQTVAMSAAAINSLTGQMGNSNAMTFGPNSAAATYLGMQIWDTGAGAASAGTMWWYGSLTTSRTLAGGDSLVFGVGALEITLA